MDDIDKAIAEDDIIKLRETLQKITKNKDMKKKDLIAQFNAKFKTAESIAQDTVAEALQDPDVCLSKEGMKGPSKHS
jgi:hypothetical protein